MTRSSLARSAVPAGDSPKRPPQTTQPGVRLHAGRQKPASQPSARGVHPALVIILTVLLGITAFGLPYYLLPLAERVRHPLHPWLKPSGYIGQSAGLLALAIFVFLWLYSLRKRVRWLAWTGAIARWLDTHVILALPLPLLVAIHSSWRFDGIIGLGFWAMMIVWLSGIVGRYLYARIPRGKAGIELTIEEIAAHRKALLEQIAEQSGLDVALIEDTLVADPAPTASLGLWPTLRRLVADDLARRRAARLLRARIRLQHPMRRREDRRAVGEILRLANREMALTQQARMLEATHRVFRFWHVAHRPVAMTALAAVLIHVTVVVALGATWLW
jgi:hypothetical protein